MPVSLPLAVHATMDQSGLANTMNAWLSVAKGDTPIPLAECYNNPLLHNKSYTDYTPEEINRKGKPESGAHWNGYFSCYLYCPSLPSIAKS